MEKTGNGIKNSTRYCVFGILPDKENKVLLYMRPGPEKSEFFPNMWGLPGGWVEKNETFRNALLREVEEETSLKVKDCVYFAQQTDVIKGQRIHGKYSICKWEGKPKAENGTRLKFLSKDEIATLPIVPYDEKVLEKYYKEILKMKAQPVRVA